MTLWHSEVLIPLPHMNQPKENRGNRKCQKGLLDFYILWTHVLILSDYQQSEDGIVSRITIRKDKPAVSHSSALNPENVHAFCSFS